MVPLTGPNALDEKENNQLPAKSKHEPEIERIKLGKVEAVKVAVWLKQLDESSNGFLQLTKSDLVNFIIRDRKGELTPKEIVQIRANHYDPIRHLNWITPRLKEALISGDSDQIARLQNEIRSIELSVVKRATAPNGEEAASAVPKQKRSRRPKKADESEALGSSVTDGLAGIRDDPV